MKENPTMRILFGFLIAAALALHGGSAYAQGPSQCNVATADPTYQNGQTRPMSCDTAGHLRTTTTVTANFAGFNPLTTGTPIAVANPSVTGTLPAGAVVVASNVGTTNTAFCKLGAAATTSDQPIVPGGWFAFTVSGATQLTCITSSSTTTVNMVGGSGLPTGVGGPSTVTATGPLTDTQLRATPVPISGALTANQSVNAAQVGGTNTDTNSGNKSAGTLRVVLATDQPALTNKLLVTPDSVALPANQSVNVAQINGVTPLMGAGNTGTGSHRVTISTDQAALAAAGQGATAAAVPAGATQIGVSRGGNLVALVGDPCETIARSYATINISSATTTRIVTPSASNKTYICGLFLIAAAAQNVGIVEGTGGTCGAATAGVIGGTTAATGPNLTAQAGFVMPNTGKAQAATAGTNVDLCLITSTTGQLSGNIVYVQSP